MRQVELGGVPVLDGATRPPGAPLSDGFVVPVGTVGVGPVVPASTSDRPPGGWEATLLLTGTPAEVLTDLDAQARALGFDAGPTGGCWPREGGWRQCLYSSGHTTDDRLFTADLDLGAAGPHHPASAGLRVGVATGWTLPTPPSDGPPAPPAWPVPATGPATWEWPDLAGPGEVVAHAEHLQAPGLRLPDGVAQAAPLGTTACSVDGRSAVLRVTGPAETALAELLRQLQPPDSRTTATTDGTRVTSVIVYQHGGTIVLQVVEPPSGPAWILVESCVTD